MSVFFNSKIKDEKAAGLLTGVTNIELTTVKSAFQTYVESLKNSDNSNRDAHARSNSIST